MARSCYSINPSILSEHGLLRLIVNHLVDGVIRGTIPVHVRADESALLNGWGD